MLQIGLCGGFLKIAKLLRWKITRSMEKQSAVCVWTILFHPVLRLPSKFYAAKDAFNLQWNNGVIAGKTCKKQIQVYCQLCSTIPSFKTSMIQLAQLAKKFAPYFVLTMKQIAFTNC